jgi:hypothetical protein
MSRVCLRWVVVSLLCIGFLGITILSVQAGEGRARYVKYEKYAKIPEAPDKPAEPEPEYIPPPRAMAQPASREQYSSREQYPCMDQGPYPCEEECPMDCEIPYCGAPGRFWFRADYMMWWTSGTELPPLVVAGPEGTPATQVEVVYGDSTVLTGGRSAVRTTLGGWLDRCHRWGIEADWLYLSGMSNHFDQSTVPGNAVGRPLYDLEKNVLAYELANSVAVDGDDYFNSTGFWFRYNLCCCDRCCDTCDSCGDVGCGDCGEAGCGGCGQPDCGTGCDSCGLNYCRADLLVGYRYYVLGDRLSIHETLSTTDPTAFFDITDTFRTNNEFHGAEIGLSGELRRGRWGLNILTKMALGSTRQRAYINGVTHQTTAQGTATYDNGILATIPNMQGSPYTRDQFTVIPQVSLELSYQMTCRLRAYVGYDLLYWAPIWRAGDQIDLFIDPRNFAPLPQPGRLPLPTFPGQYSNFWAQGINVGMEMRF